jgi:large subunit ribosomal protein L9
MKVILKSDIETLGRAGEVKDVSPGYARNYLFSRSLAMEATPAAILWFEKGAQRRLKVREKELSEAKSLCEKLSAVKLSFSRQVAEGGKLYGSVGKSDIVKSLKASGYDVESGAVQLPAPLKEIGDFDVDIRFAPEAVAKVKVSVVARR